ncbi:MAG TPA: HAMP domain-containing sensor histidine kinase [Candidatus Krumholzibacteria bacterium]|nr:HAMP domain-containing sensor histidine kinase [Candidatus Krumholzibacteria bacterium]
MARFPLRLKLTLWFLTIFATIYMGLTAIFWVVGRNSQRHLLDDGLISLADGVGSLLVKFEGDMTNIDLRPYQPVDREFSLLAVRDSTGAVVARDLRVEVDALPTVAGDSTANMITAISGDVARSLVGRNIATRMVTHRVVSRDGGTHYIDIARTTDVGRRQRLFLSDIFFVAALGGLLSATIAAWVLLGRATNPILRLAEAARRVGPGETSLPFDSSSEEMERLRTELNEALARLDQGYREQQLFLAHVAHDLKTPVSVMLTQSQVLQPADASHDEYQEYQASMVEELLRLRGIIEGILALSRAEQGGEMLRRTSFRADAVVEQCVSRCDDKALGSDVTIETELLRTPDELFGDIDLISTMLDNLLRNALRFAPPHTPVRIVMERDAGNVSIRIRDHGPGIPDDYTTRVFERFVQVPGTNPYGRGTGLGLAIAKAVCEAHQGSIVVRNCNPGCEFIVTLPVRRTGAAASPAVD